MKRIAQLLFFSIFLASCANPVTSVPNVTVTRYAEVTVTFTPAPTEISATPTKTPDPNKPADATGFDEKQGMYTKTAEDGVHLLYFSPEVNTWTELHTPEDIYLIDKDTYRHNTENLIPFTLFADPSFGWKDDLIHNPAEEEFFNTHDSKFKLSSFSHSLIASRVSQQGLDKAPDYSVTTVEAMLQRLANGETVDFTTKDGTVQHWDVQKGCVVYFVPKGTLHEDTDSLVYNTEQSQWKVYTVDNKLIVIREVTDPANDKVGGYDLGINLFAPMVHVWVDKDGIMPEKILKNTRNAEGVDVSVIVINVKPRTIDGVPAVGFLLSQPH